MSKEIWKDIEGYENRYLISNHGRLKSLKVRFKSEKILNPSLNSRGKGYYIIILIDSKGKRKTKYIHRMVCSAFKKNTHGKLCINHLNGNSRDNNISNLEWATYSENKIHSDKLGLSSGERSHFSKLKNSDIVKIRDLHSNGNITYEKIAKIYKMDPSTISDIVKRNNWKHIK